LFRKPALVAEVDLASDEEYVVVIDMCPLLTSIPFFPSDVIEKSAVVKGKKAVRDSDM
jgi:hypothetical protein